MRWPLIRSNQAACISARPADRFTPRRIAAIRGIPSSGTFPRSTLSKCKRWSKRESRSSKIKLRAAAQFRPLHAGRDAATRRPYQQRTLYNAAMIRVVLPYHLRTLARVDGELQLEVESPVTVLSVLEALEARYPVLRGTMRDHVTLRRRPFVRFFACKEDLSLEPPETPLPDAVVSGAEPFLIVGAMAGG